MEMSDQKMECIIVLEEAKSIRCDPRNAYLWIRFEEL